ncbi:MAG: AAA family ATPase, partial [Fibrobacterota bacterium]
MNRYIIRYLLDWKNETHRKPLLVRGARQVGKSFIIDKFAKENFEHPVTINFEQKPQLAAIFDSMDPAKIISQIGLIIGKPLEPGKTILFLDEIQKNPKAIMALRYFHEQMPELHVIAAGSLLEFALEAENFSFPVGRVDSLFLHPMSFLEFLEALGKKNLADWILSDDGRVPVLAVHEELMEWIR